MTGGLSSDVSLARRNSVMLKSLVLFLSLLPVMFNAAAAAEPVPEANARTNKRHPNIVAFLVDDMGVMDTSVPFLTDESGSPKKYPLNDFYRTPGMERLAAQGIRFNQFNAMSVCSPTRIALMTGQNAARHRTTNWINPDRDNGGPQGPADWNWSGLKPGDVTLPGLLRARGYRTIHVGKGHFGPRQMVGADPSMLGFDVNVGGASIGAPASYYGQQNYGNAGGAIEKTAANAVPGLEEYHGTDTFLTDALTLEAKRHVSAAVEQQAPFFLYMAHYAVHAPFNSDPRFAAHYQESGKPVAAQAFATLIEGMDKSLNDLLDHLDSLNVAEDTLMLFLGDNGSDAPLGHEHEVACAAPLRGRKGSHYEGGVRVPFIAAWARRNAENLHQQQLPIPAGAIQSQLASVPDVFSTILKLADVPLPEGHEVDGHDLRTLMKGRPDPSRPEMFLMHYPHSPHRSDYWSSYRDAEWKVIYHYFPNREPDESGGKRKSRGSKASPNGSYYQLFHLQTDPFEQNDVSTAQPDELNRMMKTLSAELVRHRALMPVEADGQVATVQIP
jgi:arylsulfatase A-like enzyme